MSEQLHGVDVGKQDCVCLPFLLFDADTVKTVASAAGRVNKVSLLATSHIFHLTGVNVYMKCCLNKLAQ